MKIKANGISINYQVDGPDGAPWLVLSNSLATNLAMWDDQARELGRAFRVLRYDQRGHGATEAPAGRYTFELLIADALALMDALAIKRAHFGGLSMGGATALGYHNYAAAVATVTQPVLFVVGEKDAAAAPMRKLNEALPGSRYVELAGAGHISNLDQPEAFTRAVKDFLAAK